MSRFERIKHAMTRWIKRDLVSEVWSSSDFFGLLGNKTALQGGRISEQQALRCATNYACVRIIAESIATLPIVLYKPDKKGGKTPAVDDIEYQLVHNQSNPESTSVDYTENTMISLLMRGNYYSWCPRDDNGRPLALWNLNPDQVGVERKEGQLVYKVQDNNGKPRSLYQGDDMLHGKAFSLDGVRGLSVLQYHARSFGIALSQEEFTAGLYENGVNTRGVLETDAQLETRDIKIIKKEWRESYGGAPNSGKTIILPFNAKYKPITISPEEAQMIQSFNYQERQICKIYRVPLHMVGNLEKSAFTNIEQQSLDFVVHCLRAWCVRYEKTLNSFLLTELQRKKGYYFKVNVNALLRGAMADRFASYQIGITSGFYTPNEVRELEEMNPVEGGDDMRPAPNASGVTADGAGAEPDKTDKNEPNEPKKEENPQEKPKKPKKKKDKASLNPAELALFDGIVDAFERGRTKEVKTLARIDRNLSLVEQKNKVDQFYLEHRNYLFNIVYPNMQRMATGLSIVSDQAEWLESYLKPYEGIGNVDYMADRVLDRLLEELNGDGKN